VGRPITTLHPLGMDGELVGLELAYAAAIEAFRGTLRHLESIRAIGLKIDCDMASRSANAARELMDGARIALEKHRFRNPT
jgi:hypothetical protein